MIRIDWPTMVGVGGMGCIIRACCYITALGRPDRFVRHGANLAGAPRLAISALHYLKIASLVLEGFGPNIATGGRWKAFRKGKYA